MNYKEIELFIKDLFNKNIDNSVELSKLIDKYLIPQELEKKQNAEVSTPNSLRQEMLDKIPMEFWTKKRKVFEPCSGKGGFLIDIIGRFMNGLKDEIKDPKERYKIIVEDCLYWSDINPTNINICKLLIDPHNKYKLNYNEGDTLDLKIKDKWNIEGFDAVIGNPPYQAPRQKENKTKGGGGDLLWNKFVLYGLDCLICKGYLLFVHPSGWRKPDGLLEQSRSKYKGLYKLMTKDNQMIYLNINNANKGLKVFKCGTRFDYYLIQKCKKFKKTIINDEDNNNVEIDLDLIPFLPNKNIELVLKIISKNIEDNLEVLRPGGDPRREYINDKKEKEYQYTMIHSTPNSGVRYKYCNIKKKTDHFDVKKIIFGETGLKNMVLDRDGEYGITSSSFALKLDKNFDEIKQALLSNDFKKVLDSCLWSNYRIDWRLFTYFKKDFWKQFV
jgi:hypothetical protein